MWSEAMHVCQFLVIAWSYTVSLFENFAEPFTNRLGAKCCISWNLLISHLSSCCLCLSCGTNLPSRSTFSPKPHTTKSKLIGLRVNVLDKISSQGEIEVEIISNLMPITQFYAIIFILSLYFSQKLTFQVWIFIGDLKSE